MHGRLPKSHKIQKVHLKSNASAKSSRSKNVLNNIT